MNPFIVADVQKCIGCRTCEVACVVAHQAQQDCATVSRDAFLPRIQVVKGDIFSSAVACHQCEDAPCMNVCPTGAIRREKEHIAVEQNRCIGCKSCMVACPFGTMQVVVRNDRPQAIKCDLCNHRSQGPACVEACPTSALRCVDTSNITAAAIIA